MLCYAAHQANKKNDIIFKPCVVWQFAPVKLFREAFFMSATVCFPVTKLALS